MKGDGTLKPKSRAALLLCIVMLFSLFASCAAPRGESEVTKVKIGDNMYDLRKLLSGVEEPEELKQEEPLPTVGTMEKLVSLFSEMGLFYNADERDNGMYLYGTGGSLREGGFDVAESAADMEAPAATAGSSDYSKTNSQVENVDEADIIKTDGKYIYCLYEGRIAIVRADGKQMTQVAGIESEPDYFSEMFVVGDRLIAVSTRYEYENNPEIDLYDSDIDVCYAWPSGKCFTSYIVYDISDRSNPTLFRRVEIEGSPLQTRLIGNTLYFVANKWIYSMPADDIAEYEMLPCYRDTAVAEELQLVMPDSIYYCPGELQNSYLMIGAFDVTALEECVPETLLGAGDTIYMNLRNLYVARQNWNYEDSAYSTDLFRFTIDGASINYTGMGAVDGYIINQYSMDEHEGFFRVATTTVDRDWNETNNLFILDEKLSVVGSVTGLAEGETIRSVRFSGDTGYVVTFEQTDPLFVIDLSDPTAPEVLGELKIPGFSEYLHVIGDGLLLGVGRHTAELYSRDEYGNETVEGVTDKGLKVSIFDVSDPANPKELHTKVFGSGWEVYSEVSYNPRSLMVDMDKGVVGLPVNNNGSSDFEHKYWAGFALLRVSGDGIKVLSELGGSESYAYNQRLIYIGDTLYLAMNDSLTAYSYENYKELASLTMKF